MVATEDLDTAAATTEDPADLAAEDLEAVEDHQADQMDLDLSGL